MFGIISRNEKKRPVDEVFDDHRWERAYLFSDGTVGQFVDAISSDYNEDEEEDVDGGIYIDGKWVLGQAYVDRWNLDGKFFDDGCFLYFEGETIKDYCDRNNIPYPIKEIPDYVVEYCQDGEFDKVRRFIETMV